MYDIAADVHRWHTDATEVALARVVSVSGLGSSSSTQAVALSATGEVAGQVLDAAADVQLLPLMRQALHGPALVVDLVVTDEQAVDAGLVCGGRARVLVQPARDVPEPAWEALRQREPICLVSDVSGETIGLTTWFTQPSLASGHDDQVGGGWTRHAPDVVRLFGRGSSVSVSSRLADGRDVLSEVLWPTPRLVVVGDGLVASALAQLAGFLGWGVTVHTHVTQALAAVADLSRADALVVLSHDRDVDGPVLAAALAGRAGYVAGLGSRRTQAARREWLRDRGVPDRVTARMHGPAGLDIGARTPAEIALSILSEAVAVRSGTNGQALRERSGPVHADGLHTPPPSDDAPLTRPL